MKRREARDNLKGGEKIVATSFLPLFHSRIPFQELSSMPALLHIDSSPRSASVSSKLAASFVKRWKAQNPSGTVIHRNTAFEQISYVDEATIGAFYTPAEALTAEQKQKTALSDKLIDELLAADVLVLGVPMWNLGIPASLKAWIDQIVRVGRTFTYTETGVASLLPTGKKVYIFAARGGSYAPGTPFHAYDQQEPYLRTAFGFLGISEIEFVHADNQGHGGDAAALGLAAAEAALAALAV
jgi:FMN-dependent NADH-azoreductase